jgi:AcrR family transcriptional regulator
LAAQLKITDSALYHYVRCKDELAALCYQQTLEFLENAVSRADKEGQVSRVSRELSEFLVRNGQRTIKSS